MTALPRRAFVLSLTATLTLAACGKDRRERRASRRAFNQPEPPLYPNETRQLRRQINKYADLYDVPRALIHKLAIRESTHRPWARNDPYMGLLQIHPRTAAGMGYTGTPEGLLDAETNLKYAVKYLRGAWLLSYGDMDTAIGWYARGYYYEAKRRGMLVETGLK